MPFRCVCGSHTDTGPEVALVEALALRAAQSLFSRGAGLSASEAQQATGSCGPHRCLVTKKQTQKLITKEQGVKRKLYNY